jgi:uncharacterized protein (DUF2235 family)
MGDDRAPRNLVFLMDGTGNQPGLRGDSNVLRLHDRIVGQRDQLVWYDPGVGTMGSSSALTSAGRWVTKMLGLAFGFGLKDNLVDAYSFLMREWRQGDRIYVFGFSRGAYSARALCGMLYQVGLLRPEHANLVPYALRHFWWKADTKATSSHWSDAQKFSRQFARRDFRRHIDGSVHFVGLWDTVNATGFIRPALELPWTRSMPMARRLFHAVSIDERRRPFDPTLITASAADARPLDVNEVWFAGVHSDIGGTFEKHGLADITLRWMIDAAAADGLRWDGRLDVAVGRTDLDALDVIHDMGWKWWPATVGHHRSIVPAAARVHESVVVRAAADTAYDPPLPEAARIDPWPRHAP